MDSPERIHPRQILLPGFLLGLLMTAIGLAIAMLRGDNLPESWYPQNNIPLEIALGLVAGLGGVVFVLALMKVVPALRHTLDDLLTKIRLEDVTVWQAVAFGLLAGIPEEILFRGGIQPSLGLWLTALLFGVAHAITPTYMVYAGVAGLCLGGLAEWRGDLWAATTAHFAYDAGMFIVIAWQLRNQPSAIINSKQVE